MATDTLTVYKASPSGDPVPDLQIHVEDCMPDGMPIEQWRDAIDQQAEQFVNAICTHLPQGLVDRIFALLALRKATLLAVAMPPTVIRDHLQVLTDLMRDLHEIETRVKEAAGTKP
jgi:hypothetical protein